ncbi:hypothetical protein IQ255_06585 [Pleurocapsales cyanobacterium LEGE 10410]|nr:hypothetical protein [Pleurocapsales cyanobacterium LEGE 10410]
MLKLMIKGSTVEDLASKRDRLATTLESNPKSNLVNPAVSISFKVGS